MKYVRHAELGIVIFEDHVSHRTMAAKLGMQDVITSAGWVSCADPAVIACGGMSQSLCLASKAEDTWWLREALRMGAVFSAGCGTNQKD